MSAANPYWDAVQQWLAVDPFTGAAVLGSLYDTSGQSLADAANIHEHPFLSAFEARRDLVQRYAWTVTDPDTVAFVVEHAAPKVLDPLAGSGYWAHLLAERDVDVVASDLHPPDRAANTWHSTGVVHHPVDEVDAVQAVREGGDGRTLLLAWPPFGAPVGADILDAYRGARVVYLGEVGDACGDERMVDLLNDRWRQVALHIPVQWFGLHDVVAVYERSRR